jgi:tRNA (guanosine-2'-O-)-methyltransferase
LTPFPRTAMLALASRRATAVFAAPRRLGRGAERFRVRFAASSSDDGSAPSSDAPAGPGMGTIVDPVPVGTVTSSAHQGHSIKRTAQRVAPRRTADPSSLPENPMERHRKRRVKKFVKRASEAAFEKSRFPYSHDDFDFDGFSATAADVENAFGPLVSPERMARLESVIDHRTFDLMPVLEGVYDIGNVLAACRSAEALGVGCLGVISDAGLAFKQSGRTSGGAVKWTHLDQWRSTPDAIDDLKKRGYRVLVTVFEGGHPLEAYDWTVPTAVILGNEREGVSEEAKEMADGGVYISMSGFTESLNVSVASALVMHHAAQDRKARSNASNASGNLSAKEKNTLRALYLAKLVPNYSRQGYLRQLLERARRDRGEEHLPEHANEALENAAKEKEKAAADEENGVGVADEIADEVALLNALEVSKIVKRPRKKKWGRPVLDDHKRIMSEVELARGSPDPDE